MFVVLSAARGEDEALGGGLGTAHKGRPFLLKISPAKKKGYS